MTFSPSVRNRGDFRNRSRKYGLIADESGRATWSSVVPAPMPFLRCRKTAALLFSKQGVIFASPTSPFAKWLYPFFISPQLRGSSPCSPWYEVVTKGIGMKDAFSESSPALRGLISVMEPNLVQAHPTGSSDGASSGVIGCSGFEVLIFPDAINSFRCSSMRSRSWSAGVSAGYCSTSFPWTASSRINSRSFFMPVSTTLPLLPRPLLDFFVTAPVHKSRCSVISFCALTPHLRRCSLRWCERAHRPGCPATGGGFPGFRPAAAHTWPAVRQGRG